jgi:hypothetical protein
MVEPRWARTVTAELLSRTDEIHLLTDWHAAIANRRALLLTSLWATDSTGLPILWNSVKAVENERLDWNRAAQSGFERDVLKYAMRNVGFVASLAADMAK